MQKFLGEAAERMGMRWDIAQDVDNQKKLLDQFKGMAYMAKPVRKKGVVFVNLLNGTFEISPKHQKLRPPCPKDFITYQLPFEYNPDAKAPKFMSYLNKVQPDVNIQKILAEYLGYLFIDTETLKLEKALVLYGCGANGKSVFFDIVNALLGTENISSFTLHQLTHENGGKYRAQIANKLVNYTSEISKQLGTSIFKAMVSGEPIEACPLYQQPYMIPNYAKFIFNCNELPKDVEQSKAFFRRFLIVPFDVTIPDHEQDKQLAQKIIKDELPGIFNWMLDGLERLLKNKDFTYSEVVKKQTEQYQTSSDSVQIFLQDESYVKSITKYIHLKVLFKEYKTYCNENGYKFCQLNTFCQRLESSNFIKVRKGGGNVIYLEKKNEDDV